MEYITGKFRIALKIILFLLLTVTAFAVDRAADGIHDGNVLSFVFEHFGEAFRAFDVGLLRSLFKEPRELAVSENLQVGRPGDLTKLRVLEQAIKEIADDDAVALSEIALIALVDGRNNLVEEAPFLFHLGRGTA